MRFGNLQYLWCLWLIPMVLLFVIVSWKRKQRLVQEFVSAELKERLLVGVSPAKQKLKVTLVLLAVAFMVIALIRPKWGFHWEEVKRRGVDIIVALDVSKSMLAEDVPPNRLERAKREIVDLLHIVQGDRIGLIAFAGTSFVQSPLTLDHGAVQIFLDEIDTDFIPVPGTAISQAIEQARGAFDSGNKNSRVLILITDGEDHLGDPLKAAKKAAADGLRIYTIGIGKQGGAPIPDKEHGGFKKDRQGEVILSKLDEETLQKIALETGGSYVRSVSGDMDLEQIYKDIRKNVEQRELQSGKQKRFEERFQWPLALAFLLLFLEPLISERRRGRHQFNGAFKRLWSRRVVSLFILSATGWWLVGTAYADVLNSSAHQGVAKYNKQQYDAALKLLLDSQISHPDRLDIKYNLANTYYKLGQYQEAEKLFQAVAMKGDQKLAQKSMYNLGNTAYRQGKLQEALAYYQQALKMDPKDEDAKFNLEFVREEIKRRIEEEKKRRERQKQSGQKQPQQNEQQKQGQGQTQPKQEKSQPKDQQARAGEKKQPKQPVQENKAAGAQEKKAGAPMSPEEAARWLSTVKDDRKKYSQRRAAGQGRYQVEKDW